jgi:hypothetical protein
MTLICKLAISLLFAGVTLLFCTTAKAQPESAYDISFLRNDFRTVDVVVYVNVKSRTLADKMGEGDCEKSTGTGYCLYLLRAEVKEVFKGKIKKGYIEFYTSPDMDYPHKDKLLGEHVVFLEWSKNSPDGKLSLFTLENSTRNIKHGVLAKMRKIRRAPRSDR